MERVTEKEREPEPLRYDRIIEENQIRMARDRQKAALLPHVLKSAEVPWTLGIMALHRKWIGSAPGDRLAVAPIYTMAIFEQILDAGAKGGRHRHVREAIFYVLEGEGHEIHDGKRYEWSAGDIMTVPTYCDHQHFNPNPRQKARMWYSLSPVVEFLGIHWIEQIEMQSAYALPQDAEPIYGDDKKLIGYCNAEGQEFKMGLNQAIQHRIKSRREDIVHVESPSDEYEQSMRLLEDEFVRRQTAPHVVRNEEIPWTDTRMGRIKFLLTPRRNCGLETYEAFVQELPPGACSGKHRHATEEVHKIIKGKGYDVHDGIRHDWEAEDVVCIPPYVVHQHFNTDARNPALFVAFQSRWSAFLGHGGVEHLEDARA